MRKAPMIVLLGGLVVAASMSPLLTRHAQGQASAKPPVPLKLKVGDMAPDFSLFAFDGQKLQKYSLSDFRGKKNVALAFFVFAFTGG